MYRRRRRSGCVTRRIDLCGEGHSAQSLICQYRFTSLKHPDIITLISIRSITINTKRYAVTSSLMRIFSDIVKSFFRYKSLIFYFLFEIKFSKNAFEE